MKQPADGHLSLPGWIRKPLSLAPLFLLVVAGAVVALLELTYFAGDFRNNLWAPSYLLLHGQSPYRIEGLYPETYAVWFPQSIGLFFPLGWLDLRLAANLWFLGNVAIFFALMRRFGKGASPLLSLPVAALIVLSPPLLLQFMLGQFDLLVIIFLLLALDLVLQKRFFWAGALVAVVLSKPQLAVLVVPGLALVSLRRAGKRGLLLFAGAILLVGALLTLPLWIGYPNWPSDFIWAQQQNPDWYQPTLYTMLEPWGVVGQAGAVLVSLVALGVSLWLWWRYPPGEALPWSLALTVVASPYIWTWDFCLLMPLVLMVVYRQRSRLSRLIWGAGWLVCWGLVGWIYQLTNQGPGTASTHWHFWMPWLFFLLVLGTHALESRRSGVRWLPLVRS